jgi:hypothetical protein
MTTTPEKEINIDDLQTTAEALVKQIKDFRRAQVQRINGFTISQGGGYFRAMRRYNGKMQTIHLGKVFDPLSAEQKIKAFLSKTV